MIFGIAIGQGEWIIILIVLLLLFGSTQLPKLARSLGSAQREFRKGINDGDTNESDSDSGQNKPEEATDNSPANKAKGSKTS